MSKEEKIVGQCKSSVSKELEALERGIIEFEKNLEDDPNNEWLKRTIAGMKKCYQRLEAIENAEPSEVLECLEETLNKAFDYGVQSTLDNLLLRGYNTANMLKQELLGNTLDVDLENIKEEWINKLNITTIKQALIKAQEQKRVLEIIKEKDVDVKFLRMLINSDSEYTRKKALKIYNLCLDNEELTPEEFDTLKEMIK